MENLNQIQDFVLAKHKELLAQSQQPVLKPALSQAILSTLLFTALILGLLVGWAA